MLKPGRITIDTTTIAISTIIIMRPADIMLTTPVGQGRGADGICERKSAAIPARLLTWRELGLATDQTPADHLWALLSSGVITSGKLLGRKTGSGLFGAATTATPLELDRDRLPE